MKYENPIMEISQFECIDVVTVSGNEVSDGKIEDANSLPGEAW